MHAEALIAEAAVALRALGIHNGPQEARWLWLHVLREQPRAAPCSGGAELDAATEAAFRRLLQRRVRGEPLQYVLGSAEFYGLELEVGPGVLIPRPETERLVDFALPFCTDGVVLCDVCTGSGAIALALVHERPRLGAVYGTDLSAEALGYARRNAARLGLPVTLLQGDLFAPLAAGLRCGVITANPPYVSPDAYETLPAEVREREPRLALWAAEGGLAVVARIARESRALLAPGGVVLCEISSEQGEAAARLFAAAGFGPVAVRRDYADRERVVVAHWPCGRAPERPA